MREPALWALLCLSALGCSPGLEAKGDTQPCGPCGPAEWCGAGGIHDQCAEPPVPEQPEWLTLFPGWMRGVAALEDRTLFAALASDEGHRFGLFDARGGLLWTRAHPTLSPAEFSPDVPRRFRGETQLLVQGSELNAMPYPVLVSMDSSVDGSHRLAGCGSECSLGDFDLDRTGRVAFIRQTSSGGSKAFLRQPDGTLLEIDQVEVRNYASVGPDPVAFGGVAWTQDGDLLVAGRSEGPAALTAGVRVGGPGIFLLRLSPDGAVRGVREYPGVEVPHLNGLELSADGTLLLLGDFQPGGSWGAGAIPPHTDLLFASAEGEPLSTASFGTPPASDPHVQVIAWAVSDAGEVAATVRHSCGGFTVRKLTTAGSPVWDKTYLPERCQGLIHTPRPAFLGDEVLVSGTVDHARVDFGAPQVSAADRPVGFLMNLGR